MKKLLSLWGKQQSGATAIEYGLIVAGIALGISIIVFTMGDSLEALFQNLSDKI